MQEEAHIASFEDAIARPWSDKLKAQITPQERTLIDRLIRELTDFIHRNVQALDKIHLLQKERSQIFEKLIKDKKKLEAFLSQLRSSDMPMMWEHKDDIIKEGKDFGELLKAEIGLMEFLSKLKHLEIELQNKMVEWHREEVIPDSVINLLWGLIAKKPEVKHPSDMFTLTQTKDIGILRIIEILYNADKKVSVLLKHEEELLTQEDIGLLIADKFETIRRIWDRFKDFNKEETGLIDLLNEKMIIQNTALARIREQLKQHESDIKAKKFLKAIGVIDNLIDEIEYANFEGAQRLIRGNIRLFSKEQAKILQELTLLIMRQKFNDAEKLLNSKEIKPHMPRDRIERFLNIVQNPNPLVAGYQWRLRINSPRDVSILHIGRHIENLNAEVLEGLNREAINVERVDYLKFYWYVEQSELLTTSYTEQGGYAMEGSPLKQLVHIGRTGSSREQISSQIFKHHEQPEKNKARLVVYLVNTRANKAVGAASIDIYVGEEGRAIVPLKIEIVSPKPNSRHFIGLPIRDLKAKITYLDGNEVNYEEYSKLKFNWYLIQGNYKPKDQLIHEKRTGDSEPISSDFDINKSTSISVELIDEPTQSIVTFHTIDIKLVPRGIRINLMDAVRRERTLQGKKAPAREQRISPRPSIIAEASKRAQRATAQQRTAETTPPSPLSIQLAVFPEEARTPPGAPSGTEIIVTYETDGTPPIGLSFGWRGPRGTTGGGRRDLNQVSGIIFEQRFYGEGEYYASVMASDSTGRADHAVIHFYIAPESAQPAAPQEPTPPDRAEQLRRLAERLRSRRPPA